MTTKPYRSTLDIDAATKDKLDQVVEATKAERPYARTTHANVLREAVALGLDVLLTNLDREHFRAAMREELNGGFPPKHVGPPTTKFTTPTEPARPGSATFGDGLDGGGK